MSIPVPTLCRLEYLTPNGWVVGHAGVNLLDPGRYVERLAGNQKFGRVTELDDQLNPTGRVWEPKELPDLSDLVPSHTVIPRLKQPGEECAFCMGTLCDGDGSCLL